MGGRTVESDEEDCSVEAYEEDQRPRRRDGDEDMEDRDNSDDEEEEGQDEYERDDFIVDDTDEEEEEERVSDDERRKKKRKKKSEPAKLEEDEIRMLEENNGCIQHRNKLKRLRKAGSESEMDGPSGFSGVDRAGKKATAEEKLEYSLFGDQGTYQPLEDVLEEDQQSEDDEVGEDYIDNEMAGFIVDDDEEIGGNGQVVRSKKLKRKPLRQAVGISSSALQDAHDIFGDVDELLAQRKQDLQSDPANSGKLSGNMLEDEFEPAILADKYMTPKDDQIRATDVPERIQLSEELTDDPRRDNTRIEEESVWIHSQLIGDGCLSFFGNERVN